VGDRIGVPLELDGFEVGDCEVVEGMLEIEVMSTLRAACHHCGSLDVVTHAANTRRIRDRACGHPVVLLWAHAGLPAAIASAPVVNVTPRSPAGAP
jgi:hypothetical protein